MDEVDRIVLLTLKSIGCEFDDDTVQLAQLRAEQVVEAVVRCLRRVRSTDKEVNELPLRLPTSMSARYKLAARLAQLVASIGFGECGYQAFLYANETETRKILSFLVEAVQRSGAQFDATSGGNEQRTLSAHERFQLRLGLVSRVATQSAWRPHGATMRRNGTYRRFSARRMLTALESGGSASARDRVLADGRAAQLLPFSTQLRYGESLHAALLRASVQHTTAAHKRVVEAEARTVKSRAAPLTIGAFLTECASVSRSTPEEAAQKQSEVQQTATVADTTPESEADDLGALRARFEARAADCARLEAEVRAIREAGAARTARCLALRNEASGFKERVAARRTLFELVRGGPQGAADTRDRLAALLERTREKCGRARAQFDEAQGSLAAECDALRAQLRAAGARAQEQLGEVRRDTDRLRAIAAQLDAAIAAAQSELERLPKDVERSAYTARILDMVASVKKQQAEILHILADTKMVQKEINNLSGMLQRTFSVAEELAFTRANPSSGASAIDEHEAGAFKRVYRHIVDLHDTCASIVRAIEDTSTIVRDTREMDEQIEQEVARDADRLLTSICADLQAMKADNDQLEQALAKQ